ASAVAVGTALFIDPTLPVRIADGLSRHLDEQRLDHISQLVGALRLPN
ncbi:MAG: dihydroorotate dehydrogenase, partial [Planctomycetota bacterium]